MVSTENEEGGVAPIGRMLSKSWPVFSQVSREIRLEIQWSLASRPSMKEMPEIAVS